MELMKKYSIGYHAKKEKTLLKTIKSFPVSYIPYQIFLGSPKTFQVSLDEEDIKDSADLIIKNNISLFIHTPYVINLSKENVSEILIKQLEYAKKAKCKGVVVHTGKYTTNTESKAIEIMYENIKNAMEYATEECPILLETPAGQGTETLTECDLFYEFVTRFDRRVCICIDTCHVFASGYEDPLIYIQYIHKKDPDRIKLIHFNDSKGECCSCVDRHEMIGDGKIGFDVLENIAKFCKDKYMMVYEG
jgi:deoxyribonuclease-4